MNATISALTDVDYLIALTDSGNPVVGLRVDPNGTVTPIVYPISADDESDVNVMTLCLIAGDWQVRPQTIAEQAIGFAPFAVTDDAVSGPVALAAVFGQPVEEIPDGMVNPAADAVIDALGLADGKIPGIGERGALWVLFSDDRSVFLPVPEELAVKVYAAAAPFEQDGAAPVDVSNLITSALPVYLDAMGAFDAPAPAEDSGAELGALLTALGLASQQPAQYGPSVFSVPADLDETTDTGDVLDDDDAADLAVLFEALGLTDEDDDARS